MKIYVTSGATRADIEMIQDMDANDLYHYAVEPPFGLAFAEFGQAELDQVVQDLLDHHNSYYDESDRATLGAQPLGPEALRLGVGLTSPAGRPAPDDRVLPPELGRVSLRRVRSRDRAPLGLLTPSGNQALTRPRAPTEGARRYN